MTVITHNQQFRDYAAGAKYPFTDTSAYTATDGRDLPLHVFVDAILYPPDLELLPAYIHGIRLKKDDCLEIGITRGTARWATADIGIPGKTWAPIVSGNVVVGTIVLSEEGVAYLSGLAEYSTLFFNRESLQFRPDRILGTAVNPPTLAVGNKTRLLLGSPPNVEFTSARFTLNDSNERCFNNKIDTPAALAGKPLIPFIEGNSDIKSMHIRTPRWSNLSVVVKGNDLIFHKRGDGYDD